MRTLVPRNRALVLTSTVLLSTAALASTTLASAAAAAPAGAGPRVRVTSDRPAYTDSAPTGAVADPTLISFSVDLALRDAAGLDATIKAVSTPGSAGYHHYLTKEQVRDRFGASQADVDAVRGALTRAGLTVTAVSPTHTTLTVSGTAAAIESAFATHLRTFRAGTRTLRAPDSTLTLPAGIAASVRGVRGLAQSNHLLKPASVRAAAPSAPPGPGFLNAPPCSAYYGEKVATDFPTVNGKPVSYAPCGYTPQQLRSAYDLQRFTSGRSPIDGRGTRVAITDAYASPTVLADAQQYSANRGERGFVSGQLVQLPNQTPYQLGYDSPPAAPDPDHDACGEQGWYGEETLDVEAVHAMAPGAQVVYAPSGSCIDSDFLAALSNLVENDLADAITNSWGDAGEINQVDQASLSAYSTVFSEAAVMGIGVYFSSGDSGDETRNPNVDKSAKGLRQADFPASHPLVTAVGGTSLGVGAQGQYLFEKPWSTGISTATTATDTKPAGYKPAPPGTYLYGAGGGASRLFDQPFYQQGVVPASQSESNGSSRPARTVPDVGMLGDPQTGMLVGQTQTFLDGAKYGEYRIGGTSLSSPLLAGLVAVADQADGFHHGFINPALYQVIGSRSLHDITGTFGDSTPTADIPSGASADGVLRHNYGSTDGISDPSKDGPYSLRTFAFPDTIPALPGYDQVTGVGTPARGFITALGRGDVPPTYPVVDPGPPTALPEASAVVGLPVAALVLGGGLLLLRRRRTSLGTEA